VPLEAQACGRPVVAYARGGALETVADGVSGLFFDDQTEQSLLEAVARAAGRQWDPAAVRANAERFDVQAFVDGLAASIERCLAGQEPGGLATPKRHDKSTGFPYRAS
jgi:glycosyltransferase involved in cell wall biosynthesis